MRIGEARRTLVLDSEVLAAAARSIGIMDHAALVAHLGMEVTQPPSMLLIAVVLLRLPVTLASVLRVSTTDDA